ncbi:MAG TPA: hypothetical protein VK836_08820, partial [Streptosporangiaceae bacterium]|nr:hypothetical protein [Streptosporangiaceae bacterium]
SAAPASATVGSPVVGRQSAGRPLTSVRATAAVAAVAAIAPVGSIAAVAAIAAIAAVARASAIIAPEPCVVVVPR